MEERKLKLIAVGMGPETMTLEARKALDAADLLVGAARVLSLFPEMDVPKIPEYDAAALPGILAEHPEETVAFLVSGDLGFYSAAKKVFGLFPREKIDAYPGMSSLLYFAARLGKPWQDVKVVSCHGREGRLVDAVRRNVNTFVLCGKEPELLTKELSEAGFGELSCSAGENLSLPDEKILRGTVESLVFTPGEKLTVLWVENPGADARVPSGLPDGAFVRGSLPMTKSCVRALILSRMQAAPHETVWDVGAGTGSVSCELGLHVYEGEVFAVEKEEEGISLIQENAKRMKLGNVRAVPGRAPEALLELPAPDACFIGGSSGEMEGIFKIALEKNPSCRMVLSCISLDSLEEARRVYKVFGMEPEILMLQASSAWKAGPHHLMRGENPVFVLSGGC